MKEPFLSGVILTGSCLFIIATVLAYRWTNRRKPSPKRAERLSIDPNLVTTNQMMKRIV